jgi:aspartyl-tRNA(Asn)/glutamyl-tRNA(Gln) amidotransferase subunit C
MAIDRAQVRHVARLARLSLSEAEEETFAAQLSHVLDYIEKLSAVDVSSVEPLAFAGDLAQSNVSAGAELRPDEARAGIPRDEALAAAPASDGASFLVPRILE